MNLPISITLAALIAMVAGGTVAVNGLDQDIDQILDHTLAVVNQANVHQLAMALELYYADHDRYPNVSGGNGLVNVLSREGYLKSEPLDNEVFDYRVLKKGQDYSLWIKPL